MPLAFTLEDFLVYNEIKVYKFGTTKNFIRWSNLLYVPPQIGNLSVYRIRLLLHNDYFLNLRIFDGLDSASNEIILINNILSSNKLAYFLGY